MEGHGRVAHLKFKEPHSKGCLCRDGGFLFAVCDAMKCIHDHDIIHRDLKPQNIIYQVCAPWDEDQYCGTDVGARGTDVGARGTRRRRVRRSCATLGWRGSCRQASRSCTPRSWARAAHPRIRSRPTPNWKEEENEREKKKRKGRKKTGGGN
eukprot:1761471-Rhodomonas_salina.1